MNRIQASLSVLLVVAANAACVTPVVIGPGEAPGGPVPTAGDTGPGPFFDGAACGDGALGSNVDAQPIGLYPTTTSTRTVLPISGGTLAITGDGSRAVVSDPDNDTISLVSVGANPQLVAQFALNAGDEPGRAIDDGMGQAHVVLRRGGAVVDIDLSLGTMVSRRAVCAAPRGITYVSRDQTLRVVCVDGTLVTLPRVGGSASMTTGLPDDLRDITYDGSNTLFITRFRSAQMLTVSATTSQQTAAPFAIPNLIADQHLFAADVAWRSIPDPQGGVIMLHQLAATDVICPSPGGYSGGGETGPIVEVAVTTGVTATQSGHTTNRIRPGAVAVDVAVTSDGSTLAIAMAGSTSGNSVPPVAIVDRNAPTRSVIGQILGQPVAVAYTPQGQLVVLTRDPVALYFDVVNHASPQFVMLAQSPRDTGFQVFHAATGGGIACAGCHPEGGDDGHVWQFGTLGARRTQNLRGGLLATAPFHWDGRFPAISGLLGDVYHGRMGGQDLDSDQAAAVSHWLDTIPTVAHDPPADPAAVARGQALFNSTTGGCTACHSGPHFTNNSTVDVGTGGALQVPSLVGVAFRAPYMHNGCAATLLDRFSPSCGGVLHGNAVSSDQASDLVAYLQTL